MTRVTPIQKAQWRCENPNCRRYNEEYYPVNKKVMCFNCGEIQNTEMSPDELQPGQESCDIFYAQFRVKTTRIQYDYCTADGTLFSCVSPSLEDARLRRDNWIIEKTEN